MTTRDGVMFEDRIDVRSATTDCRRTSLSVRGAVYRLAISAGRIGCSGSLCLLLKLCILIRYDGLYAFLA